MEFVKPIGKKPLGKPRCRWEDNIRMNLKDQYEELGWFGPCKFGIELAVSISHGVSS